MVTMMVTAKVKAEKIEEFIQVMGSLVNTSENTLCLKDFIFCRQVHEPSVFNLIFEWEKETDFECYLAGNEFSVICGATKVLCEESTFSCSSQSKKWFLLADPQKKIQPISTVESGSIKRSTRLVQTQIVK